VFAMETRLSRIKAGLGQRVVEITDRSPWDWYAQLCVCGVSPRWGREKLGLHGSFIPSIKSPINGHLARKAEKCIPELTERRQHLGLKALLPINDRDKIAGQSPGVLTKIRAGLADAVDKLGRRFVRRAGEIMFECPRFECLKAVNDQVIWAEIPVEPAGKRVGK
jgi:hypothetical protein